MIKNRKNNKPLEVTKIFSKLFCENGYSIVEGRMFMALNCKLNKTEDRQLKVIDFEIFNIKDAKVESKLNHD